MAKELKSKLIAEAKESIIRVIFYHIDVICSSICAIIPHQSYTDNRKGTVWEAGLRLWCGRYKIYLCF